MNPFMSAIKFCSSSNIIIKYFSGRIWTKRGLIFKMIFESICWKFITFFGSICPKMMIHATVTNLTLIIKTSSPLHVPLSSNLITLFENIYLRNMFSFSFSSSKSSNSCQPTRSSSNNSNLFLRNRFSFKSTLVNPSHRNIHDIIERILQRYFLSHKATRKHLEIKRKRLQKSF